MYCLNGIFHWCFTILLFYIIMHFELYIRLCCFRFEGNACKLNNYCPGRILFYFFCMQCMHSFWRHSLDIVDKMNSYNNTVLQNKLHCAPYTYISLKHSWHHSRYTETTFQLVLKWNSIKTFTRSVKNFNQRSIVLSQ